MQGPKYQQDKALIKELVYANNFRLISILGVVYKIIAKLLVN